MKQVIKWAAYLFVLLFYIGLWKLILFQRADPLMEATAYFWMIPTSIIMYFMVRDIVKMLKKRLRGNN